VHDPYLMLAAAEGFGEAPAAAVLAPDVNPEIWLADPPSPPAVPLRLAERLRAPDLAARAAGMRAAAERAGQRVLTPADAEFPERLRRMPLRPLVLFVRGDVAALQLQPAVAVVGSRTPTPYGTEAAELLAGALAGAGVPLWSGLARGIDGIAHQACVQRGTPTVAVLAGGLDAIYPPEHTALAARIAERGCLVSELPPGQRARRGHFVRRNRLLAAGASAVVVVEASLTSGALHTARFAAECGTDVHALPGPWRSERSQGCHRLLAEGAFPIESSDGLLQALGLATANDPTTALRLAENADQDRLLQALASGPRPTDLLERECALPRGAFLRALFGLEQRGAIARLAGDLWRATTSR
jgi:DNA processing protein